MVLKKRHEHGLESWVLFLDFVNVPDQVPREKLWKIFAKFGVANKIINLFKFFHANFVVKFTVDDVTQSLDCITSVKQGDIFGSILESFSKYPSIYISF